MANWLDKRIPAARQFKLDMQSIFIFPSKFGFLFLLLCLALFVLGTNYQNNLMLVLCYFLVSLFLLSLFTAYQNFARLKIQLGKTQDVFCGDQVKLPIWFHAREEGTQTAKGLLHIGFWQQPPQLEWDLENGDNPVYLPLHTQQRGQLNVPRVTFSSFYPLGLFRCWTHLAFSSDILVYPARKPCPLVLEYNAKDESEGDSLSQSTGHDDFDSLKNYRPGEPMYHVAWKQYAKGRGLISKHFASSGSSMGWLNLLPCSADELETRLAQISFQVVELSRQGKSFGLDLGHTQIEPDTGINHQLACLKALALFEWSARD